MLTKLLPYAVVLLAHTAAAQTAAPLDSLRAQANRALQSQHYAEAARLLGQQAQAETSQSAKASTYYNQACTLSLTSQPTAALQALASAQRLGWNRAAFARQDSDLNSLHALPEFAKIMARMDVSQARLADPANAQFITSDITLFWRAYDRVAKDTAHAEQIYRREYFDKGSVGLHDYYDAKIRSVRKFVANQRAKPDFYRAIRPTTLQIATMMPQIRAGFVKLKALYPEALFPNVYFVIGRWSSGGTSTSSGMIVGTDQQVGTPTTPLSELSLWERHGLRQLTGLPTLVAHEHIHYIQKQSNDPSLLRAAVQEGMADFLAELTTGYNTNARQYAYGLAHEKEIWADFTKEMSGTNWDNWIANSDQETATKPADLGYFVGYRICQAYYESMADKKQAVHDILTISDYPAFLAKSGYAGKLATR